ncbi:apoptosis regulatory protein Siva-like isoform X1 [Oratosquilla oratoria]|uniref:apoptosis regulatory protein Siva-like isoform X1 n=1 Tax=Oratosquilla oratoria TaxID=337810 RepID=UPI003F7671FD
MTKRPCPFEDHSIQFKTHVGEKEVNMGVKREENMKAVYEKTLTMLFNGSKNLSNNNTVDRMEEGELDSSQRPSTQSSATSLRQMVFTPHGLLRLCKPQPIQDSRASGVGNASRCIGCKQTIMLSRPRCDYCDNCLCDSCVRCCISCRGEFCPNCSIFTYYQQKQGALCYNCCQ